MIMQLRTYHLQSHTLSYTRHSHRNGLFREVFPIVSTAEEMSNNL